jgi:hypothetical protein
MRRQKQTFFGGTQKTRESSLFLQVLAERRTERKTRAKKEKL